MCASLLITCFVDASFVVDGIALSTLRTAVLRYLAHGAPLVVYLHSLAGSMAIVDRRRKPWRSMDKMLDYNTKDLYKKFYP